jgi:DHA1 family multidrug resistance protein-like MFS transporter
LAGDGKPLDPNNAAVTPSPSPLSALKDKAGPNIVTWDGPNDSANPRNWSVKYRWFITLLISINNVTA